MAELRSSTEFARRSRGANLAGALAALAAITGPAFAAESIPLVAFGSQPGGLAISIGNKPFATFVYCDKAVTRPYFAHVRAPNGRQLTRNHPPVEGRDLTDHGDFHPGLWMSFADVNGSDYWRLKAPVKLDGFIEKPSSGPGHGRFAVQLAYYEQGRPEAILCRELFRCDIRVLPAGFLILWDSTFSSDAVLAFGDLEEMGLGVRMATALRAASKGAGDILAGQGEIVNSHGDRNEAGAWGVAADWCDYRGELDGEPCGIALMCHPKNFGPSWFHARDYGLLVANPFGRAAFKHGEKSRVAVKPGEDLRLRYGVLIHGDASGAAVNLPAAYNAYLKLAER
jgi:hypothetical protein